MTRVLVEWAVRTLAIAIVVAIGLKGFRVRRPATRHAVWTAVLLAGLLMPVLGLLLPAVSWPLPIALPAGELPAVQHGVEPPPLTTTRSRAASVIDVPTPVASQHLTTAHTALQPSGSRESLVSRAVAIDAIYVAGVAILTIRLVLGWILTRRLLQSSAVISDARFREAVRRAAEAVGLRRIPAVVQTRFTVVPMTVSATAPTVVLPANSQTWSDATLDAVLIHEMAHIARRDLLVQQLSLVYCAAFWFNPLAWWLRRTLTNLAEDASDEAVLERGADRAVYAEIVLGFFAALKADPRRARWPALAMAQGRNASRRIERILLWSARRRTMRLSMAVAWIVALLTPLVAISASLNPETAAAGAMPIIASPWIPAAPLEPRAVPDVAAIAPPQVLPDSGTVRIDAVLTSVLVRDAQGRPVTDLSASDVHVFEDGVEQRIDVFMAYAGGKAVQPPVAASAPDQRRLFAIVIDDINIERSDFPKLVRVLESIRDYVRDDDLISLVSTGYSSIEVDATYDRGHGRFNQVIATLASADPNFVPRFAPGRDPYVAHTALRTVSDVVERANQFGALRKTLIFVSGGYDVRARDSIVPARIVEADVVADLAAIIRTANQGGMVIYPINVRSVIAVGSDAMIESLRALATNTGGFLIGNPGETQAALQRIGLEPNAFYYWLGYHTSNHDTSKPVRRVEIRVNRPGLTLDYRREYTFKK